MCGLWIKRTEKLMTHNSRGLDTLLSPFDEDITSLDLDPFCDSTVISWHSQWLVGNT